MKRKSAGLIVCMIMLFINVYAQNTATEVRSVVQPLRLAIGSDRTTNLIFPYAVKSVDRGSKNLLVQKAMGVENIVQIKASSDSLKETNLTVITADGSLYSFLVYYSPTPIMLNLNLGLNSSLSQPAGLLSPNSDPEAKVQHYSNRVALKKPIIRNIRDNSYDIAMRLTGLYIKDDVLYYQIELENSTNVRYDIDQLRFFTKDQKKSKRSSSQEIDIKPLYISGNDKFIEPQSIQVLAFALPKFTIPENKFLVVQLMEKNGGRHLSFKVGNRLVVSAKPL